MFVTADGRQRIWFDATSGEAHQVEWTGGSQPARARVHARGVRLATLDGKLDGHGALPQSAADSNFDPELLKLTLPQSVRIQDFR